MAGDASAFADRLAVLRAHVGVGTSDPATTAALRALVAQVDTAAAVPGADAAELAWWAAAAQDDVALTLVHRGDPAGAGAAYRDSAARWARVGDAVRARAARLEAADQDVAAGASLDTAIAELSAALDGATGLDRAVVLGRLARLTANVGDRFEARARADEAAALLAAAHWPDPAGDPPPGWLAAAPADLRAHSAAVVTWYAVFAVRGAVGDGWAAEGMRRLDDAVAAVSAGDPTAARAGALTALARRLAALQDAYDSGPSTPDPADWQREHDAVAEVVRQADAADLPALAASARTLLADVLDWAGRPADAAATLADARARLAAAGAISGTDRSARAVEIVRRQIGLAAAAQDSAAVSAAAADGIAVIEADRARLREPYLRDSYLRDRRLIYAAGMAAARRLGDLELLLERADLVKARGALDWLPGPPAPVAAVRASLAADEAVVYHLWADRTVLYVLTLDRDEIVCDRVLFTEHDRAELDALITDFAALRDRMGWVETELPPLGERLLPTGGARLLAGKRRVVLSPNGLLHQLPLHALAWQGRPLIDSFAVSYAPNLAALTRDARPAGQGPPVIVGVGTFPHALPLAGTEPEAVDVAARYPGADLLVGPQATRAALAARAADGRLAAAPVLHLATHGADGPRDDPLAARFLLSDGDVPGPTTSTWHLGAGLVVLSACWSAQRAVLGRDGSELFGDEVYGLQSAFFRAGAREVLGNMWKVNDDVARAAMPVLHERLVAGDATDDAVRAAVFAARAASPLLYRWAPFKLTVLGRPPLVEETS